MYKTFAYLILGRIEEPLEHAQPEEQHGFRTYVRGGKNRGIEEHLLIANMVIDKTLLANRPLWILSFDLSKWIGMLYGAVCHYMGRQLI